MLNVQTALESILIDFLSFDEMNRPSRAALYLAVVSIMLAVLACTSTLRRLDNPDILKRDDLSGQDFALTQLSGADLSNKNLRGVDFDGADLTGADFSNSDLTGASFDGAVLVGADFTNATLDERWVPIIDLLTTREGAGQDFRGVDLSDVYLPAADLSGADFRDANLSGAFLGNADLSYANLSNANLEGTDLYSAILHNANLTDAILNGRTTLTYASLVGATVSSRQLRVARLSCTRMPDGAIVDKARCQGTPPPP